jgi:hypothetical protein
MKVISKPVKKWTWDSKRFKFEQKFAMGHRVKRYSKVEINQVYFLSRVKSTTKVVKYTQKLSNTRPFTAKAMLKVLQGVFNKRRNLTEN